VVLSRETGADRDYGRNPYEGYDSMEAPHSTFFDSAVDDRLPTMSRVVGVWMGDRAVAVPYRALRRGGEPGAVHISIAGENLVVLWFPGVASALDTSTIRRGRDVGTSGVFRSELAGRALRFQEDDGAIVDEQTGSMWSATGRAISGSLSGRQLDAVFHVDTFWFAWWAYHTDTEVVSG
jgi:Protein of unknown function (DUF3179)